MIITSTPFTTTPTASDTHAMSDWQVATDANFSNIVFESLADETNLTSIEVTGLQVNQTYFARVRYYGAELGVSQWSYTPNAVGFTTRSQIIQTPNITSPADGADVEVPITFTTDAFVVDPSGYSTHESTDWQIADDIGFTNIINESLDDATNLTSYTVNSLPGATTLYIRVRYKDNFNKYSEYSNIISFNTVAEFIGDEIFASVTSGSGIGSFTSVAKSNSGLITSVGFSSNGYSSPNGANRGGMICNHDENGLLLQSVIFDSKRFQFNKIVRISETQSLVVGEINSVSTGSGDSRGYVAVINNSDLTVVAQRVIQHAVSSSKVLLYGAMVHSNGDFYVIGSIASAPDGQGNTDAFIARLNSSLSIQSSISIGTVENDMLYAPEIVERGDGYIVTGGATLADTTRYQSFVTAVSPDLQTFNSKFYSTGASDYSQVESVVCDDTETFVTIKSYVTDNFETILVLDNNLDIIRQQSLSTSESNNMIPAMIIEDVDYLYLNMFYIHTNGSEGKSEVLKINKTSLAIEEGFNVSTPSGLIYSYAITNVGDSSYVICGRGANEAYIIRFINEPDSVNRGALTDYPSVVISNHTHANIVRTFSSAVSSLTSVSLNMQDVAVPGNLVTINNVYAESNYSTI